jgi:hypothetical protein
MTLGPYQFLYSQVKLRSEKRINAGMIRPETEDFCTKIETLQAIKKKKDI